MPQTKPFAVCTEGPTVDGRVVTRQQITEMAQSYDPKAYTAVVNLEHYLSFMPDSIFSAYGKVVSLGTRETEILGEKRLQLTAVADVSDAAAELQRKKQKAFASIEITPNFTGKGISYLTGLALTDRPAALGTESMKFSVVSKGEKLAFPNEIEIEMEGCDGDKTSAVKENESAWAALFTQIKDLIASNKNEVAQDKTKEQKSGLSVATPETVLLTQLSATLQTLLVDLERLAVKAKEESDRTTTLENGLNALKTALAAQESGVSRPAATGGEAAAPTDC